VENLLFAFLSKIFCVVTMSSQSVPLRVHGLGTLDAYHVTEDELDRITRDGSDLGTEFAFAQFGVTVALSFLANILITPPMPLGKAYVVYRSRGAFNRTILKIKDRRVGPVGSQDKQTDLEQLSSTSATRQTEQNP
jgi:hypothetical protein